MSARACIQAVIEFVALIVVVGGPVIVDVHRNGTATVAVAELEFD